MHFLHGQEDFIYLSVSFAINDQVDIIVEMQVAMFVVLAMTLRRKPDVLINLFPVMTESLKYQGQDKLPVTVWMIAQVTKHFY